VTGSNPGYLLKSFLLYLKTLQALALFFTEAPLVKSNVCRTLAFSSNGLDALNFRVTRLSASLAGWYPISVIMVFPEFGFFSMLKSHFDFNKPAMSIHEKLKVQNKIEETTRENTEA
jgi:hypothetical protein